LKLPNFLVDFFKKSLSTFERTSNRYQPIASAKIRQNFHSTKFFYHFFQKIFTIVKTMCFRHFERTNSQVSGGYFLIDIIYYSANKALIRAYYGHTTPPVGVIPPPHRPPPLFLKYGGTVGRENFSRKITILKNDFYFYLILIIKIDFPKNFSI
jgi:hypothetical protein